MLDYNANAFTTKEILMKSVQQRVKACVREVLEIDPEDGVTLNSHFANDLGADSLDEVELCMCIEDEFGLEIPGHVAETLHTVGDVVTYIERKLAYQAAAHPARTVRA